MDGAARLMLLRGPDRHRSPFGRALLEGVRLSAVYIRDILIRPRLTLTTLHR